MAPMALSAKVEAICSQAQTEDKQEKHVRVSSHENTTFRLLPEMNACKWFNSNYNPIFYFRVQSDEYSIPHADVKMCLWVKLWLLSYFFSIFFLLEKDIK